MVKKKQTRTDKSDKEVKIIVDAKIYPLEAIYGASYVFLDKAYVFLDGDPEKKIDVTLKLKPGSLFEDAKTLKGEFLNELLNASWRYQISKENKNLREYIVGAALLGTTGEIKLYHDEPDIEDEEREIEDEVEVKGDGQIDVFGQNAEFDDPLGIAVPWEEKFSSEESKISNNDKSIKQPEKLSKKAKK